MLIKKLHKLVLKSWLGPFLVAFTVITFILVLQFLSKYLDELLGKDIESIVLGKVFWYTTLITIPMALPLSVLLSTLLTMGNLGERYELAGMKSSGIGLFRITKPLTFGVLIVSLSSLIFSFFFMPVANKKLYTLLYDLGRMKPTFALKKGHFYNGVDGLTIHVKDKDLETDILYNVKIFDHKGNMGNNRITIAERGKMLPNEENGFLEMTLYNGVIHEKLVANPNQKKNHQYQRLYFDTLNYQVPMSGFELEKSDENTFSGHHYMLNILELYYYVDSMKVRSEGYIEDFDQYLSRYIHLDTAVYSANLATINNGDTIVPVITPAEFTPDPSKRVVDWFPPGKHNLIINKAIQHSRAVKNYSPIVKDRGEEQYLRIRKYQSEIHVRWMLPISCIVFLFLGAPLGSIIRKGGIGIPVLVSIFFFIVFYMLMIQGRKFARDQILEVWLGMWLPVIVMFPFALLFTWQAQTDSAIMDSNSWYKIGKFAFGWMAFMKKKKPQASGTLSIEDLIERRKQAKEKARMILKAAEEKSKEKKDGKS